MKKARKISVKKYSDFYRAYYHGDRTLRFGQAFINEFASAADGGDTLWNDIHLYNLKNDIEAQNIIAATYLSWE